MIFKGKIFNINKEEIYALALNEPDPEGDLEFLYLSRTVSSKTKSMVMKKSDLEEGKIDLPLKVKLKRYNLSKKVILKEAGTVKEIFLEKVLRELVKLSAIEHYKVKHKKKPFIPGEKFSYGSRVFDEKEITGLIGASLDFWLTSGPYADEFEKDLALFQGVNYCSLTNSGSSANLLAFMALTSPKLGDRKIEKGDEVITVAAGFPTTVAPIIQYGAVPVFLDITIPSYNINCDLLEEAKTEKTKALMIALVLGNPFDIKRVKSFCDKYNLWLIEDNCNSLGSKYLYENKWLYTGTAGHFGTFSFYPPHHITTGEGGAVCTDDIELKRLVNSFRDWGRDCYCHTGCDNTCGNRFNQKSGDLPFGYDHKYVYSHFGYSLKITDLQASIGCVQLRKLPQFIKARNRNWQLLKDGLKDLEDRFILPEPSPDSIPGWFGFVLTVREEAGFAREDIVNYLENKGIQTRVFFSGNILKQPCFDELKKIGKGFRIVGDLKNSDIIMKNTFWLGVYPGLTKEMINYMVKSIKEFFK